MQTYDPAAGTHILWRREIGGKDFAPWGPAWVYQYRVPAMTNRSIVAPTVSQPTKNSQSTRSRDLSPSYWTRVNG
jgi:hypothetical protein